MPSFKPVPVFERGYSLRSGCALQTDAPEIRAICAELAQGNVLPAGWSCGYDNQNRQYFVDEVLLHLDNLVIKLAFLHVYYHALSCHAVHHLFTYKSCLH